MLYSKQGQSLKLYEEKVGGGKLVYLPLVELMYAVITAGYRKKSVFHVRPRLWMFLHTTYDYCCLRRRK